MRLDHLSYAAGPDGLASTAARLGAALGRDFSDGGVHPRFGTRNMTLPLTDGTYIEVVEALDHPASDKAPFGQAVKARSALGGGWLGWAVAVPDISIVEQRLGRSAVPGSRHRPDGTEPALAADRHQRPDRRPAARPSSSSGACPPTCTPPRARTAPSPSPASRSPVTRSGSASGSARPSRRRWRTSRSSGSPRTARPASLPRRCSPRTASSGSDASAPRR
ncbi:VOC family protein [Nocardioides convexus]|uniref:VOC family protein n=1 Tax=Nocardioides convexus TaxID=2712224 RepID=UPI003100EA5D